MASGDLVATLSVDGFPGAIFTFVSNPDGYFVISGASLLQFVSTPAGDYTIRIHAAAAGLSLDQEFTLTFDPPGPPVNPTTLQDFDVNYLVDLDGNLLQSVDG